MVGRQPLERRKWIIHRDQQHSFGCRSFQASASGIYHCEKLARVEIPHLCALHKRRAGTVRNGISQERVPIHLFAAQRDE